MAEQVRREMSDEELFRDSQPTARDRARGRRLSVTSVCAGVALLAGTGAIAYQVWGPKAPPIPASVQRERVEAAARGLYGRSTLDAFLLTYVYPERVATSTGSGTLTAEIGQTCLRRIASTFQVGPPVGRGTVSIIPAGYRGDVAALHFRVEAAPGVPGGVLVPDQETKDRITGDGCAVADGRLAVRTTTDNSEDIRWGEATWTPAPPISLVDPGPS